MKVKFKSEPRIKEGSKTDLAEAHQSRKKIFTIIMLLVVAVGAFIILRPRLWVKNKTAKVIVDGRLSEDVKLFHGSDERLLFYLDKMDPGYSFVYTAHDPYGSNGLYRCRKGFFIRAKLIAFSKWRISGCNEPMLATPGIDHVAMHDQSLDFSLNGANVSVSWQAAPR